AASAGQILATIPASDIAAAGTLQVSVFTPAPGGGTSAIQNVTVIVPTIAPSSSPTPSTTSSASSTSSTPSSPTPSGTTSSGSTTPPSSTTPSTSTTSSTSVTTPTSPPAPTLGSISPTTVLTGSSAFTLTATGANFTSGSVLLVNGSNRVTIVNSPTQLTAPIL